MASVLALSVFSRQMVRAVVPAPVTELDIMDGVTESFSCKVDLADMSCISLHVGPDPNKPWLGTRPRSGPSPLKPSKVSPLKHLDWGSSTCQGILGFKVVTFPLFGVGGLHCKVSGTAQPKYFWRNTASASGHSPLAVRLGFFCLLALFSTLVLTPDIGAPIFGAHVGDYSPFLSDNALSSCLSLSC